MTCISGMKVFVCPWYKPCTPLEYFMTRNLGLFGDHVVPDILYRYKQVLRRTNLLSSKGKSLITKAARLETVDTRLADRLSAVVADTSISRAHLSTLHISTTCTQSVARGGERQTYPYLQYVYLADNLLINYEPSPTPILYVALSPMFWGAAFP